MNVYFLYTSSWYYFGEELAYIVFLKKLRKALREEMFTVIQIAIKHLLENLLTLANQERMIILFLSAPWPNNDLYIYDFQMWLWQFAKLLYLGQQCY